MCSLEYPYAWLLEGWLMLPATLMKSCSMLWYIVLGSMLSSQEQPRVIAVRLGSSNMILKSVRMAL